jgi:hypothetical protein
MSFPPFAHQIAQLGPEHDRADFRYFLVREGGLLPRGATTGLCINSPDSIGGISIGINLG